MIKFAIVGLVSLATGFLGHLAIAKNNTSEKKAARVARKAEKASLKAEKATEVVAEPVVA